jgi:hypothetical protein
VGQDADALNPPTDLEVRQLADEVVSWSPDMARLIVWLRETGMRLATAPPSQHPTSFTVRSIS